jgi:hypothetical protein
MSLPPCFTLLNAAFFENYILQIGNCDTAAELQSLTNAVMAELSLLESTLTSQISFLAPIEALLTAPESNPAAIVTWITSFITDFLTPFLKPYVIMAEQLAAIPVEIALLVAAIEAAAARLGVSITIPSVTIGCTL